MTTPLRTEDPAGNPPGTAPPAAASLKEGPSPRNDEAPITPARRALDTVWFDRDAGWIEFNRRVLAEALDQRTPLLERVKFLGIFTSNLDEFFMKRIAVLRDHLTPERQQVIAGLRQRLLPLLQLQADHFRQDIVPALAAHGIHLKYWHELTESQQREADEAFDAHISAALTPLVIDPSQPFPFFSNLSLSLVFALHDDRTHEVFDARVKVPAELPQLLTLTADVPHGEHLFVRLHDVIRANAQKLYPGMRLTNPTLFRLTRDAEVEADTDLRDVREMVREQIRLRRYEPVVRLEFEEGADARIVQMLTRRFHLTPDDVYLLSGELDYTSLARLASLKIPSLREDPWSPLTPPRLGDEVNVFDAIRGGDLLVHHPYESFRGSVERFIEAAADDPQTVAIKMTVYRVGDDTPFVRSLIRAAEAGKQVACVIELKARFDEARNLHWAAELERAGAHVMVGDVTLKTHGKIALVVRREGDGLRTYAHIGTGNYHVRTADIYSDVGIFTCDRAITTDVVNLFHHLTGRSTSPEYRRLLVAPVNMREQFLTLIAREVEHHRAGRPARIIAKMNQLEDPAMIAAICDASGAGVPVDLIIRGFCCLRPGVPGFSESVRVRSIIGRFLEHSRVFYFANGEREPIDGDFFIGSADWMFRNLSHRVEVVAPVESRNGKQRLWEILEVLLDDARQAWHMAGDGSYVQATPADDKGPQAHGTHRTLMQRAVAGQTLG